MRVFALLLVLSLAFTACGDDDPIAVAQTPLAGQINGEPWVFNSAITDQFLSDEESVWVVLHAEPVSCGEPEPKGPRLIIKVPREPGAYAFSFTRNMTFVIPEDTTSMNLVTTSGRLVVESVTEDTVTAAVHGIYDDKNEVDGRFTAPICD